MTDAPASEEVEKLYERLDKDAEASGYHLNPDTSFTTQLVEGLLTNEERYGYPQCPCRLTSGEKEADLDIICPCDYRDPDLDEYDACYCGLYVSGRGLEGEAEVTSIPERRPEERPRMSESQDKTKPEGAPTVRVWRCQVCGYLCARIGPPEVCPICKVPRERFEPFEFP